ncbi:hypothetical protein FA15DRAFT_371666 [Coprinopsis marcescibilis]|uniref:Uncharacterized protein n=1 Tax=Coprinopsis marcescibilis TaxID=230819 RepID=A0A5C3KAI5_COPMA|nr:hypothetical protein FA15DRAFT_371666 [Coprinopsis marcescibilis]
MLLSALSGTIRYHYCCTHTLIVIGYGPWAIMTSLPILHIHVYSLSLENSY